MLFPPSIPESNLNSSAIHLQIDALSSRATPVSDCVAEDGPFRVESAKQHPDSFQIALPSPERWIADIRGIADPDGDAIASLYDVFAKLDQPRQTGCFAKVSSEIRDFILQSLPMEPNETLFNYYGYRSSRNGLDLKPGMRLKVERAYLKSAENGQRSQSSGIKKASASSISTSSHPATPRSISAATDNLDSRLAPSKTNFRTPASNPN